MIGIVLAGGRGSRFKSEDGLPKVLYPYNNKPLVQRVFDVVHPYCAQTVVVVGGQHSDLVRKVFQDYEGITFIEQENPRGTGHAVLATEEYVAGLLKRGEVQEDEIMICYGDKPLVDKECFLNLVSALKPGSPRGPEAVLGTSQMGVDSRKGRILRFDEGGFIGIKEWRDANEEERKIQEVNAGIYGFHVRSLYPALHEITPDNSAGELYLTDVFKILVGHGNRVETFPVDARSCADINTLDDLAALS